MCENISLRIQSKDCPRYHRFILCIFLHHCNRHLLAVILKCGCLFNDWRGLVSVSKGNGLRLSIQHKPFRGFCFFYPVCAKRKVFNQRFPVFICHQRIHQYARSIFKNPVPVFILLEISGVNILCRINFELCTL